MEEIEMAARRQLENIKARYPERFSPEDETRLFEMLKGLNLQLETIRKVPLTNGIEPLTVLRPVPAQEANQRP